MEIPESFCYNQKERPVCLKCEPIGVNSVDKTILIVEDDQRMRVLIRDYLVAAGFGVLEAENGFEALKTLADKKADLIVLDIMMPEMDGWDVCKKLRERSDIPVIMLTAKAAEEDKLLGYELGADDYITKPFNPQILTAKIKVLLKRTILPSGMEAFVQAGNILMDTKSHDVLSDGKNVRLTAKEYDLLLYLVQNKNIVLSRDQILDAIWGFDFFGDLRTVDTNIKRLRAKLGRAGEQISTMIGYGYKLEVKA